ncbi:MAG: TetR/AcrR family transcriptional regulator [Oscillospiraceae bacterium]
MPPKPKFTREEIIEAALKIASDKGMKALTSRELGAALGSSARPIFTAFKNMDEVNAEVRKAALKRFDEYAKKAEGYTPLFKQVGLQMILFAVEQPKLFRLLFMSENSEIKTFEDIFSNLGETADMCIDFIIKDYGVTRDEAMLLFRHTWIFTYGVGALIASGSCHFTEKEIQDMLSREFVAVLTLIRSGKADSCTTVPQKEN